MPIAPIKEEIGQQIPAGAHLATCYRIVYLGTQTSDMYGAKRKLVIWWELPHERAVFDGVEKPLSISKFYTLSLNKKSNLRKHLIAWRGRDFTPEELNGFKLSALLGKSCQLGIEHSEDGRAQVAAVIGVPKGTQMPPAFNPLVEYSIDDDKNEVYAKLPEWVRKMADQCEEWNQPTEAKAPGNVSGPVMEPEDGAPPEDETPF